MTFYLPPRMSPDAASVEANTRIQLTVSRGGRLVVHPGRRARAAGPPPPPPPAFEPFAMPPLPGRQFDRLSRLLRLCWRRAGAAATWLLYVDPGARRRWRCAVAAQACRADGTLVRVDGVLPPAVVSDGAGVDGEPDDDSAAAAAAGPEPHWLLAGTYSAHPAADDEAMLLRQLPRCDGLRLYWRPGNWADARALAVAQGAAYRLPVEAAVLDDPGGPGAGAVTLPWTGTARPADPHA